LLSQDGKHAFITEWKSFEYPRQWQKLPNPVSHHESFMMADCLRLAMMMPFILNRFLRYNYIKSVNLAVIQHRCNINRRDAATKLIITCWRTVAETMAIVFKKSFNTNDYMSLQECLKREIKILSEVIVMFFILLNFIYTLI
jgi:hypothetical protein